MFAQKQPSLKECVIAHWSSDSAPKIYGTKRITEIVDSVYLSGRGAFCCRTKYDREDVWTKQK